MGLSRERKVFIGLLTIAGGALAFDLGVLRPGEARAEGGSVAAQVVTAAASAVGIETDAEPAPALGFSDIAQRLRLGASSDDEIGDAFLIDAAWLNPEPAPRNAEREPQERFEPVLTAAMPLPGWGVAVIDGRSYRVGDAVGVSGYRLVRVEGSAALLSNGDRTMRLTVQRPEPR